MSALSRNRTTTQGKDQQVLEGIAKDLQECPFLYVGGKTHTPTSLAALIQRRIDLANAVVTAKAAWLKAGTDYMEVDRECSQAIQDLKHLVVGGFGPTSPKLADFGFAPRKKAELTPEQKAAAVLKRAATRKARGTLGPKATMIPISDEHRSRTVELRAVA